MPLDFDPYAELGIASSASLDDIKTAYRRSARRLHPDTNRHSPGAAVQFRDITAAYEFLIDPEKRASYDSKAAQEQTKDKLYFTFRVTTSKRSIMTLSETQVIYMLAEIFPDIRAAQQNYQRESRLNLTLVLDHSNSMNGVRLEKVKAATHQIIDKLDENDIFSVVMFNDRAETVIDATPVRDKAALKARVSMMNAFGGTELRHGLTLGIEQNRRFLGPKLVNHVIILTDGHTYGDQESSIALARDAAKDGMAISAMGLGHEWNDKFLEELTSATGGSTSYISSAGAVARFMNEHVRHLANVFAERMTLSIATDPDIRLESAFKLAPNPQPLSIEDGAIPIGALQHNRNISVLLQFEIPASMSLGFRSIARLVAAGDILSNANQPYRVINDMSIEVTDTPAHDDPPAVILHPLGKLTLYRMQESAQLALERGDVQEATRKLETLATRLLELGENALAQQAQEEAKQVAFTNTLSEKGRIALKYTTRYLLAGASPGLKDE